MNNRKLSITEISISCVGIQALYRTTRLLTASPFVNVLIGNFSFSDASEKKHAEIRSNA